MNISIRVKLKRGSMKQKFKNKLFYVRMHNKMRLPKKIEKYINPLGFAASGKNGLVK